MTDAAIQSDIPAAVWWYQQASETKGPLSEANLKKLSLPPNTPIWRESFGQVWRPISECFPAPPQPPRFNSFSSFNPKWEPTFKKFDEAEGYYQAYSVWGFLFSFLYYFYLRMWKKGFIILGASLWSAIVFAAIFATLNFEKMPAIVNILANIFCGIFAKRDYYLMKRRGETVWPPLRWLDKPWAIAAFVIVSVITTVALASWANADEDQPQSTPRAAAASVPHAASIERRPGDEVNIASAACKRWLEERYGGSSTNPYEPNLNHRFVVNLTGGTIIQEKMYFGGHKALTISASVEQYDNGQLEGRVELPQQFCVLNDNLAVIGAENEVEVTAVR